MTFLIFNVFIFIYKKNYSFLRHNKNKLGEILYVQRIQMIVNS